MNESKEYLIDLLKALLDENVEFVVCGGVAAVLHGVERLTLDLDISLNMDKANLKLFLIAMENQKMVPRAPIPPESILDPEIIKLIVEEKNAIVFTFIDPTNPVKQIDFFLTEDKSYQSVINRTNRLRIEDGYFIEILDIDKLIEMKLAVDPPRDKDLYDIAELKRIRGRKL